MVNFRKYLTNEQKEEWDKYKDFVAKQKKRFSEMDDANLTASAQYFLTQMSEPYEYPPGMPVYNAAFYHAILPELFNRISKKDDNNV